MTQAPTPGPLSVGNLHTAIMEALAEDIQRQRPDAFREEDENGFEGDVIIPTGATPQSAFAKVNVSDLAEVILPLVAPTAPVEASGSERERLARAIDPYAWDDAQYAEPGGKGQQWSQEAARKSADRVLALRPQPSGETREQAMSVERIKGWLERNPQGGAEPIHPDDLRALLSALSTTPARAEAQDEGAMGEVVTALLEAAGFYEAAGLPMTAERLRALAERHSAHPSPTPAADADRVRIAVEALEPFADIAGRYLKGGLRSDLEQRSPDLIKHFKASDFYRARQALAALQSTAAKEGGE